MGWRRGATWLGRGGGVASCREALRWGCGGRGASGGGGRLLPYVTGHVGQTGGAECPRGLLIGWQP